jgi:hypothetical protein
MVIITVSFITTHVSDIYCFFSQQYMLLTFLSISAHAFFTLEQKVAGDAKTFKLKRISNEFVFMAPSSSKENTGDVIQFASGIDIVGSDESGKLMISYGINDCEAAIVFLDMKKVQEILLPVGDGEEVVDLMKKLA